MRNRLNASVGFALVIIAFHAETLTVHAQSCGRFSDPFAFGDGDGEALYAGGWFTTAANQIVNHIAKWNGSSWSPLRSGMDSAVSALTVFDDGTGSALYAGGSFTTAGGISAPYIAKWDGTEWSALSSDGFSTVYALDIFDDGLGPALVAGGRFTTTNDGVMFSGNSSAVCSSTPFRSSDGGSSSVTG